MNKMNAVAYWSLMNRMFQPWVDNNNYVSYLGKGIECILIYFIRILLILCFIDVTTLYSNWNYEFTMPTKGLKLLFPQLFVIVLFSYNQLKCLITPDIIKLYTHIMLAWFPSPLRPEGLMG